LHIIVNNTSLITPSQQYLVLDVYKMRVAGLKFKVEGESVWRKIAG